MREFLKALHDYPDESKGIAMTIVLVFYFIVFYKLCKSK